MDLEIRTTSLMAVNNQLEKQTRKQTQEMKEMRKKIANLIKYPGRGDSLAQADPDDVLDNRDSEDGEEDELGAEDDIHEVGTRLLDAAAAVDRSIRRAVLLSEQLLADARRGLHYRPRESEIGVGVRKVLQDSTPDLSELVDREEDVSAVLPNESGYGAVPPARGQMMLVDDDDEVERQGDEEEEEEDISGLDLAAISAI